MKDEMFAVRYVTCKREVSNACNTLAGNPKGKKSLRIPRRTWLENVTLVEQNVMVLTGSIWPRTGSSGVLV